MCAIEFILKPTTVATTVTVTIININTFSLSRCLHSHSFLKESSTGVELRDACEFCLKVHSNPEPVRSRQPKPALGSDLGGL